MTQWRRSGWSVGVGAQGAAHRRYLGAGLVLALVGAAVVIALVLVLIDDDAAGDGIEAEAAVLALDIVLPLFRLFPAVFPTFPVLGPLGALPLPSKWVIRIGAPMPLEHLGADAAHDELLVSRVTEDLRSSVQTLVDMGLADRSSVWS